MRGFHREVARGGPLEGQRVRSSCSRTCSVRGVGYDEELSAPAKVNSRFLPRSFNRRWTNTLSGTPIRWVTPS